MNAIETTQISTIQGKGVLINDADNGETYLAEIVRVDKATDPRLVLVTLVHPAIHNGAEFQLLIAPSQAI